MREGWLGGCICIGRRSWEGMGGGLSWAPTWSCSFGVEVWLSKGGCDVL